jgi:hypothetical protein
VRPPKALSPRERLHFLVGQSTMANGPAQVTIRAELAIQGHDSIFPVRLRLTRPGERSVSDGYVPVTDASDKKLAATLAGAMDALLAGAGEDGSVTSY